MQNIKVGCIPVRQALVIDTKFGRIRKFIKKNRGELWHSKLSC